MSATVGARLVVPARLLLSEGGAHRVVSRGPSGVEIEVPLRAAANLEWVVTVRLPSQVDSAGGIAVQREDGSWVALSAGVDVAVTGARAPTNPTPIAVRVRVPAESLDSIRQLVFGIVRAE